MLNILGDNQRFCDGVSRRDFLKIGGLALGGWSLTDMLAAEAQAQSRNPHKAVIMVYLPGGPSHQDMFDLKMDAPSEVRGEFKPIKTNVPGIEICEHLPKIAAMMDKFAVVRSLVGARDEHANPIVHSGHTLAERRKNHPALGAVMARVYGSIDRAVPPFVDIIPKTKHSPYTIPASGGFLGRAYGAVRPDSEGAADMVLRDITLARLSDRRKLLTVLDRFRRQVDDSEAVKSADAITQKAFDILTSPKFSQALDFSREDPKVLAKYGTGQDGVVGDACPMKHGHFVAARRLVEAGARCVTLGYGFWDWHGNNFNNLKKYLPMFDHAITALVSDLDERGMLGDVSIVCWGEFGRTPRINKNAGRDHWPHVSSCLLAGGGMRTGQLIGTTTADGGHADERPIHYRDVHATLLHNVGFDVRKDQVTDNLSRPHWIFEGHAPIEELV